MARIKFESTYELLKYLYLKGILKGYSYVGPNDPGSGAYPEILNSDIKDILFYLFYEYRQTVYDCLGETYDSIDFDLKITDNELIIVKTISYRDYYEIDEEDEDDSIEVEEAKEFIDFMVKYGHFEDTAYEFEEDQIK